MKQIRALGLMLIPILLIVGCQEDIESRIRKETLFTDKTIVECSDGLQPTQAALINKETLLTKCGEDDINLALRGDVDRVLKLLSTKDEKGKATAESKDELNGPLRWQFISQSLTSPVLELKIRFLDGINYNPTDEGRKVTYTTRPYLGLAAKEQEIQVGEAVRLYYANNVGVMIGGSPAKEKIH